MKKRYSKWKKRLYIDLSVGKKPLGKPTPRIYKDKDRRSYRMKTLSVICLAVLVMDQFLSRIYDWTTMGTGNAGCIFAIILGILSSLFSIAAVLAGSVLAAVMFYYAGCYFDVKKKMSGLKHAYKIVSKMLFHLMRLVTKSNYFDEYRMSSEATDRWVPDDHSIMQITDGFVAAYKEMYWLHKREGRNGAAGIKPHEDANSLVYRDFGDGVYGEVQAQLLTAFYGAWTECQGDRYEDFLMHVNQLLEVSADLANIDIGDAYIGMDEDLAFLRQYRDVFKKDIEDLLELSGIDCFCQPFPRPADITPEDILMRVITRHNQYGPRTDPVIYETEREIRISIFYALVRDVMECTERTIFMYENLDEFIGSIENVKLHRFVKMV